MKELLNIWQALGRDEMKKLMTGSRECEGNLCTNCILCYGANNEPPRYFYQTFGGQDPNQFCRTRGPYPYGTWGQCP